MPPRRRRSAVPPATPRRLRVGLWARGMGTRHCEWTPETKDSKTVSPPCNTITLARFLCTRNTLLPFRAPSPRPTVGRNLVHRQQSHIFAVIACTTAAPRPARHWRRPMTHTHTACRAPASTRRLAPRLSAHPGCTRPVRCAWTRHRRAVSSRLSIPRSKMRGNRWRNTRCPAAAPRRKTGTVTKWRAGTDVHNPPRHLCQDLALSRASVKLTACS